MGLSERGYIKKGWYIFSTSIRYLLLLLTFVGAMLMLVFGIDNERWAIASADIQAILPFVNLQALPHSHVEIAGLLSYRGRRVHTVDVSKLIAKRDARSMLNTRIVVVLAKGEPFGLIVEQVAGVARLTKSPSQLRYSPYTQAVLEDEQGLVQQISIDAVAAYLSESSGSVESVGLAPVVPLTYGSI